MKQIQPLDQLCQSALRQTPAKIAIEFEGREYTWQQMASLADELTDALRQSNCSQTPLVAFIARNLPESLAAFLALIANRCTIRMVYPFQSADAIAKELANIRPNVTVAMEQDLTDTVTSALQHCGSAAICLKDMQAHCYSGLQSCPRSDHQNTKPEVILLTSGTTGKPKPFPIDYEKVNQYFTGLATKAGNNFTNKTDIPALVYFPVSNVSGLYSTLPPLVKGVKIELLDRFNLDKLLDFVDRHQPESFGLPPAAFKMVLDKEIPIERFASIKTMAAGAAPLDVNVQKAFEERYQIPILLSYGATEFGGPVCAMTLPLWEDKGKFKHGSVGKPYPGMSIRVINPETHEPVANGQEGILEVISSRIGPGWIRTSDLALIDDDGFLFIKGRADGAIIRGGFKLVPSVIEEALLQNPMVAAASVAGVADDRLGQVPGAVIVLKSEFEHVSAQQIEQALRKEIPATYIPTVWKFLDELPRTPSMKVDMPRVRKILAEQKDLQDSNKS